MQPDEPAQLVIYVGMMSAHAESADSQQLWRPRTFTTMRESGGWVRLTTVFAASYARLTSSLRANIGTSPPAPWHWPERLVALMFSHRLMRNACTSAVAGGGPL